MTIADLSKRNTRSKRIPEIDSLYVYATRHKAKFTHRHQKGAGYSYLSNGILLRGGEDEIHIYHRTAEIRGVVGGLTMVTRQSKFREVQRFFSDQIKVIENDDKLFDTFSKAKATPIELGLRYTYS